MLGRSRAVFHVSNAYGSWTYAHLVSLISFVTGAVMGYLVSPSAGGV